MNIKNFFFIIFVFLFLVTAYSKGSADKDYSEVYDLLDKNENDLAIDSAINVLEKNPNSSDTGIELARNAMKVQEKFSDKFNELMELLYNDPENNAEKLSLIEELEKIKIKIDPEMHKFLDELKYSSIYAIYKIYFNGLMDEGVALIKEEKYIEAYEKFTSGFSIYNREFQQKYDGTPMQTEVNKHLNFVNNLLSQYKIIYSKLLDSTKKYGASEFGIQLSEFSNIQKYIIELEKLEMKISNSGIKMKKIYNDEAKAYKNIKESLFPFAYRLILGRKNSEFYEGVDGAVQASIHYNLDAIEKNIWLNIEKEWALACATFNLENNNEIKKNIEEIKADLLILEKLAKLNNKKTNSQFKKESDEAESQKRKLMYELNDNILDTKKLYTIFLKLKALEKPTNSSSSKAMNLESKDIDVYILQIDELNSSLDKNYTHLRNKPNDKLAKILITLLDKQEALIIESKKIRINFYEQFAIQKNAYGLTAKSSANKKYEIYKSYITKSKNKSIQPTKALAGFNSLKKVVIGNIDFLEKFIAKIKSVKDLSSPVFDKNKQGVLENIEKLNSLLNNLDINITQSKALLLKIQLAKNEADLRYKEAFSNFKRGDFERARKNIVLSREKTDIALNLEEDDSYRKETDKRLLVLGKKINDTENTIVISDVRRYLEKGKQNYFNGEFQKSENNLNLAKNRWAVTHVEPNEEVSAWLAIVRAAGTLKNSRVIPVSAALYPQMTQLLNNATQLYFDSYKLIKSGQKNIALTKLADAKENIKQVLLVYPFNETAGQLSLKIDKLIDPKNFNEQFKRKIKLIRLDYKKNPQRLYSDLLDLYSIDKNFAGIKKLKNEIEIYLGIKLAPPNLKAIAESKRLTASARRIYKSGEKASFPVAVQQLNMAIKLDPKNMSAIRLNDALQRAMGGDAVVVLSSSDENKYKQAVEELQKGNKVIAAALIKQLMQSPNARNSAKVLELKKRLDAQL